MEICIYFFTGIALVFLWYQVIQNLFLNNIKKIIPT